MAKEGRANPSISALDSESEGAISDIPEGHAGSPVIKGAKRGPKPDRGRLIILPSQFYDGATWPWKLPECRLLLAILADAVDCFQKYVGAINPQQRALFAEARDWLMSDPNKRSRETNEYFSFDYICDVLSLDHAAVRDRLRRWELQEEHGESRNAGLTEQSREI